MAPGTAVEAVRAYARRLNEEGFDVRFAVLYGSYANGSPDEWSDIDVVVVSPRFDGPKDRADIDRLWVATLDVDDRIEPVACGLDEWEHDDARALIEIARRTGQRIELEMAA